MAKKSADTATIDTAAAAIETAEEFLQRAHARVVAATIDLREKRKTLSDSITAWQSRFKVSEIDAARDHIRRTAEHAAAARLENKPAEVAPPLWPIEAALRQGKSPNAGINLRRPRGHLWRR
jgi:hypothetical protein